MIVATYKIVSEALQTRVGVAALTAVVFIVAGVITVGSMLLYYEGVPIGPLRYVPGIHYVFPEGKIERVKREAVEGLVLKSELDAANARIAKFRRDLDSANLAAARYSTLMQEAQAREAAQIEADRKDDAEFTRRLTEAGRRCDLDQSDIDWLRK